MSYTLIEYRLPIIYPHRLNFFFYCYHNKSYNNESLHDKVKHFVLEVFWKMNLNMQMSNILIEYAQNIA